MSRLTVFQPPGCTLQYINPYLKHHQNRRPRHPIQRLHSQRSLALPNRQCNANRYQLPPSRALAPPPNLSIRARPFSQIRHRPSPHPSRSWPYKRFIHHQYLSSIPTPLQAASCSKLSRSSNTTSGAGCSTATRIRTTSAAPASKKPSTPSHEETCLKTIYSS